MDNRRKEKSQPLLESNNKYLENATLICSAPAALGTGNAEKQVVLKSTVITMDTSITTSNEQESCKEMSTHKIDSEHAFPISINEVQATSIPNAEHVMIECTASPLVEDPHMETYGGTAVQVFTSDMLLVTQVKEDSGEKLDYNHTVFEISSDIMSSYQEIIHSPHTIMQHSENLSSVTAFVRADDIDSIPHEELTSAQILYKPRAPLDGDTLFYTQVHLTKDKSPLVANRDDTQIDLNIPKREDDKQLEGKDGMVMKLLTSPTPSTSHGPNETKEEETYHEKAPSTIYPDTIRSFQEAQTTSQIIQKSNKLISFSCPDGAHTMNSHSLSQGKYEAKDDKIQDEKSPHIISLDIMGSVNEAKKSSQIMQNTNMRPSVTHPDGDSSLISPSQSKEETKENNTHFEKLPGLSPDIMASVTEAKISSQIMQNTNMRPSLTHPDGDSPLISPSQSKEETKENTTHCENSLDISPDIMVSVNEAKKYSQIMQNPNKHVFLSFLEQTCPTATISAAKGKEEIEEGNDYQEISPHIISPDIMGSFEEAQTNVQIKQNTYKHLSFSCPAGLPQLEPIVKHIRSATQSKPITPPRQVLQLAEHKFDDMYFVDSNSSEDIDNMLLEAHGDSKIKPFESLELPCGQVDVKMNEKYDEYDQNVSILGLPESSHHIVTTFQKQTQTQFHFKAEESSILKLKPTHAHSGTQNEMNCAENVSMQAAHAALNYTGKQIELYSTDINDDQNETEVITEGSVVDVSTQTEISGICKIKLKRSLEALCLESCRAKNRKYELKMEASQVVPDNEENYCNQMMEQCHDDHSSKIFQELDEKSKSYSLYGCANVNNQAKYLESRNEDQDDCENIWKSRVNDVNNDQEVPSDQCTALLEEHPNGNLAHQCSNFLWPVNAIDSKEQQKTSTEESSPSKVPQIRHLRLGLSKKSKPKQRLHQKSSLSID